MSLYVHKFVSRSLVKEDKVNIDKGPEYNQWNKLSCY